MKKVKKIIFSSFGFKYGIPRDANYVFDVRFVSNPFYVDELKPLTGEDEPVRQYIGSFEEAGAFLASAIRFLDDIIPRYLEDRDSLHIAVGCTGGKHRSVAFAGWLCEHYKKAASGAELEAELLHRDIGRA